ncbi:MAG TPA: TMEM165/GDT1 family protein [Magnetospirillaceae bacterium]|jgi:putative Ca2+/H+ antiporter (TMEM165/GDT1 family)
MEAFLIAFVTVAIAEMGDRTQLLTLVLSARFRKPIPIILAILVATLVNHALAGAIGVAFGRFLTPEILDAVVGASMLGMAIWTLIPDKLGDETKTGHRGAFVTTLIAFFIAEIGDKTQIATVALAAGYSNLPAVVAGTTAGMLAANIPVVFLGSAFAARLPMAMIHRVASALFAVLGLYFIAKAVMQWTGWTL